MLKKKTTLLPAIVFTAALVLLASSRPTMAQTSRPTTAPTPTPAPASDDLEAQIKASWKKMHDQFADELKTHMGATDDEWKVLLPRIEKLSALMRDAGITRLPLPDTEPPNPNSPNNSPSMKAQYNLFKLLQNKDTEQEDLKAALETCRKTKAEAKEKLAKAQAELRELCTIRQECFLYAAGVLE